MAEKRQPIERSNESTDEEEAIEERPAIEELGGESEHSMREAHIDERGSTRRRARGHSIEEIDVAPEDMGRRALEDATQTTQDRGEGVEPLRGPLD